MDQDKKLAKLPKAKQENYNVSKLAKYISTTNGLIDASNPTELLTMPSRNIVTTLDLSKDKDVELSSSNITLFDLSVMDSVYTLYKNGCSSFTPEMVARIMSGNIKKVIKPQKAGAVTKSLRKLATIRITLDCTEEFEARGIKLRKGAKATYTDYLMPLREVQLKSVNGDLYLDGFMLIEVPVIYDYAERIGKIATVPMEYIQIPGISDTENLIRVRRYLIQRIEDLKGAKRKTQEMRTVIYYDDEMMSGALTEVWYDENIKNMRDKKAQLHKMAIKILKSFQENKYIKDYKEVIKENRKLGVEIEV